MALVSTHENPCSRPKAAAFQQGNGSTTDGNRVGNAGDDACAAEKEHPGDRNVKAQRLKEWQLSLVATSHGHLPGPAALPCVSLPSRSARATRTALSLGQGESDGIGIRVPGKQRWKGGASSKSNTPLKRTATTTTTATTITTTTTTNTTTTATTTRLIDFNTLLVIGKAAADTARCAHEGACYRAGVGGPGDTKKRKQGAGPGNSQNELNMRHRHEGSSREKELTSSKRHAGGKLTAEQAEQAGQQRKQTIDDAVRPLEPLLKRQKGNGAISAARKTCSGIVRSFPVAGWDTSPLK